MATGHLDYHITVIDAVGGDTAQWGGMPIYDVQPNDRTRYFIKTENPTLVNDANTDTAWAEYAIEGDARDIANWRATGRTWSNIRPD